MAERRIAVLGFGMTGQAMLDHLLRARGRNALFLYNDEPVGDPERRRYEAEGVTFLIGEPVFERLAGMDRLILSPGFDGRQPRFAELRHRGVEILSEIEFACRLTRAKVIAVSGTNGKSTTVSLIHHLLRQGDRESILAGNIGIPLVSLAAGIGPEALVVLEISSFQLEEISRFRPHVALLLNLTPDHLDRYPSMDAYAAAKLRLFENQKRGDFAVVNGDDSRLQSYRMRLGRGKAFFFSASRPLPSGASLDGNEAVLRVDRREERISLAHNPLRGVHNLENILAAFLAVRLVGLAPARIEAGLASFRGLPHRMQWVGTVNGVEFINDSKATNVDATVKSITSIEGDLVVILGGKDKGGDFTVLGDLVLQRTEKVLLIGMAAEAIAAQLPWAAGKFIRVADLKEAVQKGYALLRDRDRGVVLLAPGCASFDMFRNFEHRGEVFAQEVALLKQKEEHG